ncbi:hypothetical protein BC828DRAFT_392215 [Blastocladiella britannica]|nr:hypothetical protein BC828DRAFT_392215 [Blastocladiella britannica]
MDWLVDHGCDASMTEYEWFKVAVWASAKSRVAVLDWIWDHGGLVTVLYQDQAVLVDAAARGDLDLLYWWDNKLCNHPNLFYFTLLGQRKILRAAARNGHLSSLVWWLELACPEFHITGQTRHIRKNQSHDDIVFLLKCNWFAVD